MVAYHNISFLKVSTFSQLEYDFFSVFASEIELFCDGINSLTLRHFSGFISLLPSRGCQDIVQAVQIISSITQLQYEQL